MTPSPDDIGRAGAARGQMLDQLDSVYILPFPDWEKELRSNRWHYATRWARSKPVVMVNAVLDGGPAESVTDPAQPNMRVLRVQSLTRRKLLASRHIQLGQVLDDMDARGYTAPLVWAYNPRQLHLYAQVPAVARVYHATEAFFDMAGQAPQFLRCLNAMIAISDVTIAVSEGVADGVRRRIADAEVVTVTNGCDYRHYSAATPNSDLRAAAQDLRGI